MSEAVAQGRKVTIETAEASDFENCVGQKFVFRMTPEGTGEATETAELELLQVTRMDERPQGLTVRGVPIRSKPFSILFRSATHYPRLGFAMAALDHPGFAGFELLLACVTPLMEEPGAFYYQAIFN